MSDIHSQDGREIPVEQDEIDAAAAQAQTEPAGQFDAQGRLARTVITTKDFLAGGEAFDVVNGLGRGAVAMLGTLAGKIHSVEKKEKEYPAGSGTMLTSYWLNGNFQAVVASTGEVFNAGQAILPKAYGVQVYNAFKDLGVIGARCGVTVGLRLSGRSGIPYEWIVRDHMPSAETAEVAAMSDQLGSLLGLEGPKAHKRIA